jgi:WD40 repeat protein
MQLRGDILVSGAADHQIRAWNVETGTVIHAFNKDPLNAHEVRRPYRNVT